MRPGSPASTIRPARMMATRCAIVRTTPRSWEMNRYDVPLRSCNVISSFRIAAWTEISSADVGSSQMISLGLAANARAIPTRCFSPPDNSLGWRSRWCSPRLTISSSSTIRRRSAGPPPASPNRRSGRARMPPTVQCGFSAASGFWKMNCTSRCSARVRRPTRGDRTASRKRMDPASGTIRPAMQRASVDFPDPLSPTIAKVWPAGISSVTSSTARTGAGRRNRPPW